MSGDDGSYRLTTAVPATLSDAQRAVYDEITSGPRSKSARYFRLVEDDGSLTGPFDAMLQSPRVGMALQRLGAALRSQSSLTDRDREVATLAVAATRRSGYEWYAHESAARAVGVLDDDIAAIRRGDAAAIRDPRDRAIALAAIEILLDRDLTGSPFDTLRGWLAAHAVVDLLVLVGYYDLLSLMMTALRAPMPRGTTDPFAE